MALEIDKRLNLVIPLPRQGQVIYVHSMPLGTPTFRHFFRVMSKAFAQMHKDNLQLLGGLRVMGMMLEDIARSTPRDGDATSSWWEGPDGVEQMLIPEIRRLTNVVLAENGAWKTVPYDDAVRTQRLVPEEIEEVEGAISFFTVSSAMHSRIMRNMMLESAAAMYGLQTTSSSLMEFMSSLTTSTTDESIGEKVPAPTQEEASFIPH